jgi:hypothetical protein
MAVVAERLCKKICESLETEGVLLSSVDPGSSVTANFSSPFTVFMPLRLS